MAHEATESHLHYKHARAQNSAVSSTLSFIEHSGFNISLKLCLNA